MWAIVLCYIYCIIFCVCIYFGRLFYTSVNFGSSLKIHYFWLAVWIIMYCYICWNLCFIKYFAYQLIFYVVFFYLDIFPVFVIFYNYHWHSILLHCIQSCFYVIIANIHFHHQELSLYVVAYMIMITATQQCNHHQLHHKLTQQNII